ncbi:hypothetical protein VSX64_18070 [Aurantimonas sp. C2-6-R+9]|uniref:hypothetical protein n=1 Tax=unclassified Aurantimonas TaxID=2638230 RepID=UPI002E172F61|nr:hypothetical protein [Aurantimonas sp. C2-6-R+9]
MDQSGRWADTRSEHYSGDGVTKQFLFIFCAVTLVIGSAVSVGLSAALPSGSSEPLWPSATANVSSAVPQTPRPASVTELKQRVAYLEGENARLSRDMASLMGSDGVLQRVIDRLRVLQGRDEVLRQNVVDILTGEMVEPASMSGDPSYDSEMLDARMQPEESEPLMTRARHSLVTKPTTAPGEAEEVAVEEVAADATQDDPDAAERMVD